MNISIFGYGGHAREVARQIGEDNITFFVDDRYVIDKTLPISRFDTAQYEMLVAVSDPKDRHSIVNRLPKGTKFYTFIHPTALIMSNNITIGEGSFIGAYTILTDNICLGKHTILNRHNQVGHDTQIGDYFSAMPGAVISGNVRIGDRVYLGTNSSIREQTVITNDVTIGLNTGIVSNITAPGVYYRKGALVHR